MRNGRHPTQQEYQDQDGGFKDGGKRRKAGKVTFVPPFQEIVFKDTRSSKIVAYSSAGWLLVHREKGKGKEVTEGDSCVENEKMASTRFRQFVAVCPPNEAQPPKLVRLRSFSFCISNPLSRAGGLVLSKGVVTCRRRGRPWPTHSPTAHTAPWHFLLPLTFSPPVHQLSSKLRELVDLELMFPLLAFTDRNTGESRPIWKLSFRSRYVIPVQNLSIIVLCHLILLYDKQQPWARLRFNIFRPYNL